jgi:Rieske Fe-S protein
MKGYIYAKSSSEVMVFSNICTHQGCEVPFNQSSQTFVCPCHGSTFSLSGEVVKGPAQTRLPLFQNKVVGGMVYAKLS